MKIKVKKACKNQFKRKNQIIYSPPDKIIQCSKRKDESCTSKRQQKQANYFEINRVPVNLVPT